VIELSLNQALLLYASVIGLGAIAIWVYTEFRTQRGYHVLTRQHLWRCTFCAYSYLDEAAQTVSTCPRCESINTREEGQDALVRAAYASPAHTSHPEPATAPSPERRRNPAKKKGRKRGGRKR